MKQQLKFRVHNPQHSEAIQKRLFELGAVWYGDTIGRVQITDSLYLYFDGRWITHSSGSSAAYFNEKPFKLTTLDELYSMTSFEIPITIGGNEVEFTDKGITVGCTSVGKDVVKQIYDKLFGVVLLFLFVLSSCGGVVEIATPAKEECEDILIQYRDDVGKWIVWWLPDLDPAHTGAVVYHNGEPVRNACLRTSDLKLSETGAWSIFVAEGDVICVDYDSEVTPDDFECCSYAK